MTAAQERARLAAVRAGLHALAAGQSGVVSQIFADDLTTPPQSWKTRTVNRLLDLGLISWTGGSSAHPKWRVYSATAKGRAELGAMTHAQISDIAWAPDARRPRPPPDPNGPLRIPAPDDGDGDSEGASSAPDAPPEEVAAALLKFADATIRNVVYMREKIDSMELKLEQLLREWEGTK